MTNFQITIGYKAVACINVSAKTEAEAKAKALELFKINKDKMYKQKVDLQDDNYAVAGVLNMDESWSLLD